MKPKDTKRAIDQLIGDIQDNEWYCIQEGSESGIEDWEKELIIAGLRRLLRGEDRQTISSMYPSLWPQYFETTGDKVDDKTAKRIRLLLNSRYGQHSGEKIE